MSFFFFFQAEDGIRDLTVTGVQTCALPILHAAAPRRDAWRHRAAPLAQPCARLAPAGRRGTPRLPALARAPQRQPGIPRGGEGSDGARAMTLLLMWAALVQAPRLTSSGEIAALFAQRDSDEIGRASCRERV